MKCHLVCEEKKKKKKKKSRKCKTQDGTYIRNSLFFSFKTRLDCQPTLVTTIECVSSMITSVIVQIGHGNRVGEREREGEGETKGKKSSDKAKQRKKNELIEVRTTAI